VLDESLPGDALVLLLGLPGAGKGLVGRLLGARLAADFFSMGDLLRLERARESKRGTAIRQCIDEGIGVDPSLSYGLMASALSTREHPSALIVDGIPRRAPEVGRVRALLGYEPTAVIVLDVPTVVAIDRLTTRTSCIDCGWPYGPGWPAPEGLCAHCGAGVVSRPDDSPLGIERRYEVWGKEARDVIGYYERLGVLSTVRADLPPLEVVRRAADVLVAQSGDEKPRSLLDSPS
jgi:adenylate kinase